MQRQPFTVQSQHRYLMDLTVRRFTSLCLMLYSGFSFSTLPKLTVQIVVDQLRGDLLELHMQRFGDKGFKRLFSHGLYYQNAFHRHANTVTCAGHAVISTGAEPALHGIIANDWYDQKLGREVYCVEDTEAPLLIDGEQRPKDGRSPNKIATSTLSDSLTLSQKGRAFGVSLKDRAAITLAGHTGKAFWMGKNTDFISSQYYFDALPKWVQDWNKKYPAKSITWTLSHPIETYKNRSNPGSHRPLKDFNTRFPHSTKAPESKHYMYRFSTTPFADARVKQFALQLIREERLGQMPKYSDYLGISFSSQDIIGHKFGPDSIEVEENLLQLDRTIAQLLDGIDASVGLENTLIILTSDHGVPHSEDYLKQKKMPLSLALNPHDIESTSKAFLKRKYALPPEAFQAISFPFVYLNHEIVHAHDLSVREVSHKLAEKLDELPSLFRSFAYPIHENSSNWLVKKVERMHYPGRSGDIYVVARPYAMREEGSLYNVIHGSPWRYDSYVPLLFFNPKFLQKTLHEEVSTQMIAPTLSQILQLVPPSAAAKKVLLEVTAAWSTLQ